MVVVESSDIDAPGMIAPVVSVTAPDRATPLQDLCARAYGATSRAKQVIGRTGNFMRRLSQSPSDGEEEWPRYANSYASRRCATRFVNVHQPLRRTAQSGSTSCDERKKEFLEGKMGETISRNEEPV